MKKLTTKWFRKWSRKANLSDNLYKISVKRDDSGKRSGYRTIIAFQENDRAIFLYEHGEDPQR